MSFEIHILARPSAVVAVIADISTASVCVCLWLSGRWHQRVAESSS